jgi:hypothetical protein
MKDKYMSKRILELLDDGMKKNPNKSAGKLLEAAYVQLRDELFTEEMDNQIKALSQKIENEIKEMTGTSYRLSSKVFGWTDKRFWRTWDSAYKKFTKKSLISNPEK